MVPFVFAALAEVLVGFFIYAVYDPRPPKKMYMYKFVLNFDKLLFDVNKDAAVIRKANQFFFLLCLFLSGLILANGLLSVKYSLHDFKETILLITIFVLFPARYVYIFIKRKKAYS